VASGREKVVPVSELAGAALGLSRKDTQRRLEALRGATRDEWLRARRRERVVMRLIRSDGDVAKHVMGASRALGLSRSSIYRYCANTDKPLRPPVAGRSSWHPETASATIGAPGSPCDPSNRGEIPGSPSDDRLWTERGDSDSMPAFAASTYRRSQETRRIQIRHS
jgi:hypothetical protein